VDVPDSFTSLSTMLQNGEDEQGEVNADNDDVMKEGDFQMEAGDSNGSDENENLNLAQHIEFSEH
jgi:hypothetical protein